VRGATRLEQYSVGNIGISIILGRFDDSELDLVVKAQDIPLETKSSALKALGDFGITIKEASSAENIIHWPKISLSDPNRRSAIYTATMNALFNAENIQATQIGFFTMGLEVSRLPTWEIAEEIVKAINLHSKKDTTLHKIMLVASSPTQVSSFQYAINNISIISEK
jgi:O-acetyl-ADP-ribose deacetylase (regulator of RNase III)